jgi:hypothetical protein
MDRFKLLIILLASEWFYIMKKVFLYFWRAGSWRIVKHHWRPKSGHVWKG